MAKLLFELVSVLGVLELLVLRESPINWNWYLNLCRKVLTQPVLERLFPGELFLEEVFLVGAN